MNTTNKQDETLEEAAINNADTFCDNKSNCLLNVSEKEVWKECKSQFKKGSNWQKKQDKVIIDKLSGFIDRIIGSMALERVERFDLNNEAKELLNSLK